MSELSEITRTATEFGVVESIVYRGVTFKRFVRGGCTEGRYFHCSVADRRDTTALHRQVYIDDWGPLPKGWHVHHIDGNLANNELDNLFVMTHKMHTRHHGPTRNQPRVLRPCTECGKPFLSIHPNAFVSLCSDECRRARAKRGPEIRQCVTCGQAFKAKARYPLRNSCDPCMVKQGEEIARMIECERERLKVLKAERARAARSANRARRRQQAREAVAVE